MSRSTGVRSVRGIRARFGGRGRILREAFQVVALLSREPITVEEVALKIGCNWRTAYRLIDSIRDSGIGMHESAREQRAAGMPPTAYRIPAAEMRRVFGGGIGVAIDAATVSPERVHEAMQDAPHDGRPYRQARAAIAAVLRA